MVTWTNVETIRRTICFLEKKIINAEDVRSDRSHSRLIKIGTKAFEPLKVTRYCPFIVWASNLGRASDEPVPEFLGRASAGVEKSRNGTNSTSNTCNERVRFHQMAERKYSANTETKARV
jgi:hypothetical protein